MGMLALMTMPAADRREPFIPVWSLPDRLRKVRRELGLDQRSFAEKIGVSKDTYTSWETGRNSPKNLVAVARRVEQVSGVPAAWVLGVYETAGRETVTPSVISWLMRDSASSAGAAESGELAPVIEMADYRARNLSGLPAAGHSVTSAVG
jgi:transcriptional regulator with XRE-family HTH domain